MMLNQMPNRLHRTGCVVAGLVVLVLLAGCAAGGYGRIAPDTEVTAMFRSNRVPETFKYYFDGGSSAPYALIGIAPDVPHEEKFWRPLTPNSEDFVSKVQSMYHPVLLIRPDKARGAWILNGEGKKIGVWYSIYSDTVVLEKDGVITVVSPFRPIL